MKNLIYIGCLTALICLHSCGYDMIKGSAETSDLKLAETEDKAFKLPVPIATKNLVVTDEKDLTGYWVGSGVSGGRYFTKKINFSIEEITNGTVNGHYIVAGTVRPFTGTIVQEGASYIFKLHELPGNVNNGQFEFSITKGDSILQGTRSNGQVKEADKYSYRLKKMLFSYDPYQKLIPRIYPYYRQRLNLIMPQLTATKPIDTNSAGQSFFPTVVTRTAMKIDKSDSILKGTWGNRQVKDTAEYSNRLKKMLGYDPHEKFLPRMYRNWDRKVLPIPKLTIPGQTDTNSGGEVFRPDFYISTTRQIDQYNASTDLLTKKDVANLKKYDIMILRSSIYARHGFAFKEPQLFVYYDDQPWYIPMSTDVTKELTNIEKKNIDLLIRYEKFAKDYYDFFGR